MDSLDHILSEYYNSFIEKKHVQELGQTDPLMKVYGISPAIKKENPQYWGRELGMCWQKLVTSAAKQYCPNFQPAFKVGVANEPVDLLIGKDAIDTKYRIGSGDSGTLKKFKHYGKSMRDMGYNPVLLILRTDNLNDAITACRSGGWNIYEGDKAFNYIQEKTGFDLKNYLNSMESKLIINSDTREINNQSIVADHINNKNINKKIILNNDINQKQDILERLSTIEKGKSNVTQYKTDIQNKQQKLTNSQSIKQQSEQYNQLNKDAKEYLQKNKEHTNNEFIYNTPVKNKSELSQNNLPPKSYNVDHVKPQEKALEHKDHAATKNEQIRSNIPKTIAQDSNRIEISSDSQNKQIKGQTTNKNIDSSIKPTNIETTISVQDINDKKDSIQSIEHTKLSSDTHKSIKLETINTNQGKETHTIATILL